MNDTLKEFREKFAGANGYIGPRTADKIWDWLETKLREAEDKGREEGRKQGEEMENITPCLDPNSAKG